MKLYIKPLAFRCQKVLPLEFDDSLSYYEAICKIAEKLNETISTTDNAFNQLETDVNAEFNNKQDTLVSGQNIKTVNGQSILGNGNINIEGAGAGIPMITITVDFLPNSPSLTSSELDILNSADLTAIRLIINDGNQTWIALKTKSISNNMIFTALSETEILTITVYINETHCDIEKEPITKYKHNISITTIGNTIDLDPFWVNFEWADGRAEPYTYEDFYSLSNATKITATGVYQTLNTPTEYLFISEVGIDAYQRIELRGIPINFNSASNPLTTKKIALSNDPAGFTFNDVVT